MITLAPALPVPLMLVAPGAPQDQVLDPGSQGVVGERGETTLSVPSFEISDTTSPTLST